MTGSKGFVGRHFCAWFKENQPDAQVTSIDLVDDMVMDVRDFFRIDGTQYDLVLHCAAVVGGRATIDGEPLHVATDLSIDAEMFNWAVRTEPGKVVYFSSSAAYPTYRQAFEYQQRRGYTLKESDLDVAKGDLIDRPDMTYGWAKLTGELLAWYAREFQSLDVLVVRPFSGYGEDQDLDYPFPSFIQRAKRRDDPFVIWGDGGQTRDFIHIDDVVRATMILVRKGVRGPVNLGTGVPTSFNQLASLVCDVAGYSPTFEHDLSKPTGVFYRVADVTRLSEFYVPIIDLEEGVRRALK